MDINSFFLEMAKTKWPLGSSKYQFDEIVRKNELIWFSAKTYLHLYSKNVKLGNTISYMQQCCAFVFLFNSLLSLKDHNLE